MKSILQRVRWTLAASLCLLTISGQALAGTITASPTSCVSVAGIGSVGWSNPTRAVASDASYATVALNDNATSNYLQCTGYGFAVPSGATITGITVMVERNASDTLMRDSVLSLIKAGAIVGSNLASTTADYPTADQAASYGGYNNMWGTTWTSAQVNASNFGVTLAVTKSGTSGGPRTVSIDHIQVTVHYSLPCAAPPTGIPTGVSVSCYCDDFNRTSLDNSPFFGANWITSISGTATQTLPGIVTPGYLQLTSNGNNNAKAATVPAAFPAAGNFISVDFQYFAYDGSNADGIAVTLSDYTVPAVPGAFGGSLGYGQKGQNPISDCAITGGCPGFAGGWIGVGIDEYGNFQNSGEGRCGGASGSGTNPMVGVRGSGSGASATNNYCWLKGSGSLSNIAAGSSLTRGPGHRYQIIVDARLAASGKTYVAVNRDTTGADTAFSSLVSSFDAFAQGTTQAAVPANWQISFTGSTGGATNTHEIANVRICASNIVPPSGGTASGFNAIDEAYGTPSATVHLPVQQYQNGHIFMKVVGQPFKLNVAALNNSQIQSGYVLSGSKDVSVKLVDNSDGVCVLDSSQANYCSAACKAKTAITGGSQTLSFISADQGQKQSGNFTINTAYKNLAAIISENFGANPTVACSTDAFSVRPLSFKTVTTTATNNGTSGAPVFKAGSNTFSITAVTNGVTLVASGYNGVPKVNNNALTVIPGATVKGQVSGTFPAATPGTSSSTSTGATFTYSEVGRFYLPGYDPASDTTSQRGIIDGFHASECSGLPSCVPDTEKAKTWTGVDSISTKNDCIDESYANVKDANGKYGCLFGMTRDVNTSSNGGTNFGRFIPDHFGLVDGSTVTPACVSSGFTYMSQPFSRLMFQLEAQNGNNGPTRNYEGALASSATVAVIAEDGDNGTNLTSRIAGVPAGTWTAGSYSVDTTAANFMRLQTSGQELTPDGPYDSLQLGINVLDADGITMGGMNMNPATAGTCGAACDSRRLNDTAGPTPVAQPTKVRFGRLKLSNAHGSDKLDLPIPMRAEYWNSTTGMFVTNTLDSCTQISCANVALLNHKPLAFAGNMPTTNILVGSTCATPETLTAGVGRLKLKKPTGTLASKGSVEVCVDLGTDTPAVCTATSAAQPWLQGKWRGADPEYNDDPWGRATFGVYKNANEFIYFREMY